MPEVHENTGFVRSVVAAVTPRKAAPPPVDHLAESTKFVRREIARLSAGQLEVVRGDVVSVGDTERIKRGDPVDRAVLAVLVPRLFAGQCLAADGSIEVDETGAIVNLNVAPPAPPPASRPKLERWHRPADAREAGAALAIRCNAVAAVSVDEATKAKLAEIAGEARRVTQPAEFDAARKALDAIDFDDLEEAAAMDAAERLDVALPKNRDAATLILQAAAGDANALRRVKERKR